MAAPKNECVPLFDPGTHITAHAKAAVIGKTIVTVADAIQGGLDPSDSILGGNIIVQTVGVGNRGLGVADQDAAAGGKVGVFRNGVIVPVTAGAAVAAGAELSADAEGKVITQAGVTEPVGQALTAAAAADDEVIVALYI